MFRWEGCGEMNEHFCKDYGIANPDININVEYNYINVFTLQYEYYYY